MNILISNANDKPIYEQIYTQIRNQILSGALPPGQALPSIRALAKDLRVSVITTKRAYEELEKAGYLYTVPAKGSYVAEKNTQLVREAYLTQIEEHMTEILSLADSCGLGEEELLQMFRLLYETHARWKGVRYERHRMPGPDQVLPGLYPDHITFTLPAGCILGLVGENGAGKSTTLKLLMNATSREDGQVSLLGTDNQSPDFLQTKQDIGVVLDEACLPEVITPLELGKLMSLTYTRWDQPLYESYLTRFDIPRTKQFKDFSRGMKMKLAIAAALSHGAKLLLLDEATSGLDPMVRDEVLDVFNEFTRDETHTVVLSSHIVSDLEKICDYIAFLHKGKLILFEEKDQLLEEYAIVKLSPAQLAELDRSAVAGVKQGPYGAEALVKRNQIPAAFVTEHTTLEDIILFLAKTQTEVS